MPHHELGLGFAPVTLNLYIYQGTNNTQNSLQKPQMPAALVSEQLVCSRFVIIFSLWQFSSAFKKKSVFVFIQNFICNDSGYIIYHTAKTVNYFVVLVNFLSYITHSAFSVQVQDRVSEVYLLSTQVFP